MVSLLSLVQIIFRSSGDYILLVLEIIGEHIQNIHDLRLLVYQSQHNDAECILELGMLVQLIQDHIGIGVLAQFNDHPDALSVGLVPDIRDTVYFL